MNWELNDYNIDYSDLMDSLSNSTLTRTNDDGPSLTATAIRDSIADIYTGSESDSVPNYWLEADGSISAASIMSDRTYIDKSEMEAPREENKIKKTSKIEKKIDDFFKKV